MANAPKALASAADRQRAAQPALTADDKVFEQATTMLWSPLVGSELRSALFKVLAGTTGVKVDPSATDAQGRSAVKISRYIAGYNHTNATYESPQDRPGAAYHLHLR